MPESDSTKKLTYQYAWSLMDRILLVLSVLSVYLLISCWHYLCHPELRHHPENCIAGIVSILCLLALLKVRQSIFSPQNLFARLRSTVYATILDPGKLQQWQEWDSVVVKDMQNFHAKANDMLDSIGDFYTCLISPEMDSSISKGKSLSDFGLSCGMKTTPDRLLIFDKDGNLLPEQDEHGNPRISCVIWNSPAYTAGLRSSDVLLTINNRSCANLSLGRLYSLEGFKNSVSIRYKRSDEEKTCILDITQKTIPQITYRILEHDTGYLRIENFERVSVLQMYKAFDSLRHCESLIVDLRGNRGGDIRKALLLLSAFLEQGVLSYCERRLGSTESSKLRYRLTTDLVIVEVENKDGNFESLHPPQELARFAEIAKEKPVVVLINEYSMSGAELFAGALKDYKRATIIGTRTFGKGVGQDVFSIPPCVKVSVTSMKFTTPNGTWPGDGAISAACGIEPDECVELSSGATIGGPDDNQLTGAMNLLRHK